MMEWWKIGMAERSAPHSTIPTFHHSTIPAFQSSILPSLLRSILPRVWGHDAIPPSAGFRIASPRGYLIATSLPFSELL